MEHMVTKRYRKYPVASWTGTEAKNRVLLKEWDDGVSCFGEFMYNTSGFSDPADITVMVKYWPNGIDEQGVCLKSSFRKISEPIMTTSTWKETDWEDET